MSNYRSSYRYTDDLHMKTYMASFLTIPATIFLVAVYYFASFPQLRWD